MNKNIGQLIKDIRLEKKLTLKQVSEKTGLSISFLSQVERSKSSVTLVSLTRIAQVLNVSPSYFFAKKDKAKSFLHRSNKNEVNFSHPSFFYQGLSGDLSNPDFEPMIVTLLPNQQRLKTFTHSGQEFLYVLEGTLTVLFDEEEHDLYPGDSFHVDSSNPHNWFNQTKEPVKMLYVRSHSNFM